MPAKSVHCPVLGAHIVRIINVESECTGIICPEYLEPTKACRLKKDALDGGPLSQLLERVEESTLGSRTTRCDLI